MGNFALEISITCQDNIKACTLRVFKLFLMTEGLLCHLEKLKIFSDLQYKVQIMNWSDTKIWQNWVINELNLSWVRNETKLSQRTFVTFREFEEFFPISSKNSKSGMCLKNLFHINLTPWPITVEFHKSDPISCTVVLYHFYCDNDLQFFYSSSPHKDSFLVKSVPVIVTVFWKNLKYFEQN